MRNKKKYKFQTAKGSIVTMEIETEIENLHKEDLEEILHEYATCTHNFYLSLGEKIKNIN